MYQAIQDFGKYKVGDIVPEADIKGEQSAYVVQVADKEPVLSTDNKVTAKPTTK